MAVKAPKVIANVLIDPSEVVKSRRGRRANTNQELLDFLGSIPEGKVAVIGSFGEASDPEMRNKIGSEIRKHWRMVHSTKPQIDWNPNTNLPQVGHKVVKG